ncbi:MAG: hypothetical protein EZS28_043414 [Streblomastix strix]|uniref:Uncharacterized protein n=1 Tax=Streblomastix strix TaxID=222440 RepID=A0A5J4TSV1_9EUKA|nr:MAG: hypothetical protein EZS28_043414 [Streblomastix strix]
MMPSSTIIQVRCHKYLRNKAILEMDITSLAPATARSKILNSFCANNYQHQFSNPKKEEAFSWKSIGRANSTI